MEKPLANFATAFRLTVIIIEFLLLTENLKTITHLEWIFSSCCFHKCYSQCEDVRLTQISWKFLDLESQRDQIVQIFSLPLSEHRKVPSTGSF